MCRVLNKKNSLNPADAIYVGRPSVFGNPFVIGRHGDRAEVVEKYRQWLSARPELVAQAKKQLRGHDLICWCAPLACHADVLLEISNQE